ncbi:actinorhodin polyketide synthase [Frankia sp. CcI156]|uniref:Phosphopantetheine-binding n=1 Tax=Frankia casuarinae (strain DSM 45818 / CECT 9043 / HFP020203 / CcI3) TaxID=106370 RepID=Q2J5E7_FRACC|nr:phosphopantetheine-binding [Frankia casuarinae]ESZ99718.1 acyl carrier protein [Frankia sp. CcI6]KFB01046.1 acyl carrier protein [Frankia sp. Allo2]OFB44975.1 actinorhodin polyketide synthase [Frankia sp. CgIM4]OHV56748.1 actinorhodin polyketide synthase [Frankia sp. CgIS1]ONH21780.1 actinorhodin polyketide synthase [Frankia sp. CcI156]
MNSRPMTIDDLRRVLREGAGAEEGIDLDGDILDTSFESLGYDSLALLETTSRIANEYGVKLSDDAATSARTPRELLELVNVGSGGVVVGGGADADRLL